MNSLELKHNHVLSPEKSRFYRCNRVLNPLIKRKLEINDVAGIRPNKSYMSIVVEAGDHKMCLLLKKIAEIFLIR